jgi:lipopolysaccharide transport system permease protein
MPKNTKSAALVADLSEQITVIKPNSGWKIFDWQELRQYRDLFFSMVSREIKVLYAQTILGFSWAILQPLIQIVIFTIVFRKVARISSEGFPYIVFSTVAILPWNYMSQALTQSSQSLVSGQAMLGKVYFPRLIFPITPILARLLDFLVSLIILLPIILYYRITPTWQFLLLPLFILMMMVIPAGAGMCLSSMAIRFRDVKFATPFLIRMLIYTAPILYSASAIPEKYRLLYSLNPIVGVIEGFRACILGTAIPWEYIFPGMVTSLLFFFSGALYFKRTERVFVDVI